MVLESSDRQGRQELRDDVESIPDTADLGTVIQDGDAAAGELAGTYPSPTVAATHSGSAHHTVESGQSSSHTHLASDAHASVSTDTHHPQAHTAASHSDQGATGAELETLTDGSNADSLHVHSGLPIALRKAADESVTSSTTLQNDNHFSFAIGANEVWIVKIALTITLGGGNGGLVVGWSLPSGGTYATQHMSWEGSLVTAASMLGSTRAAVASGTSVSIIDGSGSITIIGSFITFTIINSSTGGTAQFQWAQHTSDATATTLAINSSMAAVKV